MENNSICKIVYFDEDSVTDYVQIIAGGELEKTTELLKQSTKSAEGTGEAKVSVGISKIFKALVGLEAQASAEVSIGASINTNKMVRNIVKNTILTDFLNIIDADAKTKSNKLAKGSIKKFEGYEITIEKDSLSYIVMVSPYFSMMKTSSGIPAGEFNISIEKLENALKNAKGYYEFIATKDQSQVVLRFNIDALKNNYKINDLLKMNLSIYAIKVGTTSISKLNINNELEIDVSLVKKDNPEYEKTYLSESENCSKTKILDVYDVLLAGVEVND